MRHELICPIAEHIYALIRQKRALGYTYNHSEYLLSAFDKFFIDNFPDETTLNQTVALKWSELKEGEHSAAQLNRISVVRELARYMNSVGIAAYIVPPSFHRKRQRYVPHIYTQEELKAIFQAADNYPQRRRGSVMHLIVPVLFRLMYCCGLRPIEGLRLRVEDIDLNTGCVKILESKGHKDRIVVMTDDMLALTRRYNDAVEQILPSRTYFFHSRRGDGLYCREWSAKIFRDLLSAAGLSQTNGPKLREYDLRHTFATHRLYLWLHEGADINACFPYLSEYMGHTLLSKTAYYIHLVPEFYPNMIAMGLESNSDMIPEVPN